MTATAQAVSPQTAAALTEAGSEKKGRLRPAPKQLNFDVGGSAPDLTILKVKSAEITLDAGTQHKKGETLTVELEVRIDEIAFVDKYDAHGNVSQTKRIHVAKVLTSSEDGDDD